MANKDDELLGLLRLNARESIASLARSLGLSRTTVQDRLRKLERDGSIAGYAVRLGKQQAHAGLSAMVTLAVEPRRQIDVAKSIGTIVNVETLYTVSGKYDLIAMVRTPTAELMDDVIDKMTVLEGVTEIETAVILSTKLDRR
jgi:DNA-binding Lrp family transcriptional regulator